MGISDFKTSLVYKASDSQSCYTEKPSFGYIKQVVLKQQRLKQIWVTSSQPPLSLRGLDDLSVTLAAERHMEFGASWLFRIAKLVNYRLVVDPASAIK